MSYQRASEATLMLDRQPVSEACPECGHNGLETYPVHSEGGWFVVVKCPACLHSVSRERWRRLGPIELLSDSI